MKGALAAPFLFLALAVACASSRFGYVILWAASALALVVVVRAGTAHRVTFTGISSAAFGYAALVVVSTLLLSPAYTPAGLYHPLLLLLAFLAARRFDDGSERAAFTAVLALGAILGTWGLAQVGLLGMARAHAVFETPATYAAALNLLLVPVLVALLCGRRHPLSIFLGVLLAAALFAAGSRGGDMALAAGGGAGIILARRAGGMRLRGVGIVLAMLAAGWVLAAGLRALPALEASAAAIEARAESSQSRLELYALSWNTWLERPLAGTGYLTFRHALERKRELVPGYGEAGQTEFVHNDYLQSLQELGPVGLLAFLGLTLLPLLLTYRRLPALMEAERLPVVVCASTLAAMAFHALVDFPFYVPACLLLYGAFLGALDRRLGRAPPVWSSRRWHRPVQAGALAIAAIVLLRPIAAEAAAEWGLRKAAAGGGQDAAFWLGVAQRIDTRDWRYHWYAGQFWDAQAAESRKRETARLAAAAYAAGAAANPLEVKNLLGMISVHRRHRQLLDSPADAGTLQAWMARAEMLAPFNRDVRRERELVGAAR
jgi:O-antigen ligase